MLRLGNLIHSRYVKESDILTPDSGFTNLFHRKRQVLGTYEMKQTRNSRITNWLVKYLPKLPQMYLELHLTSLDDMRFRDEMRSVSRINEVFFHFKLYRDWRSLHKRRKPLVSYNGETATSKKQGPFTNGLNCNCFFSALEYHISLLLSAAFHCYKTKKATGRFCWFRVADNMLGCITFYRERETHR